MITGRLTFQYETKTLYRVHRLKTIFMAGEFRSGTKHETVKNTVVLRSHDTRYGMWYRNENVILVQQPG